MTDERAILVPVAVLEGETVSPGLVDLLSASQVHLLGYHEIPEQTAPGQARMSFEEKAQEKMADVVAAFERAGADVDSRLVFTHDPAQSIERVADETGSDAVVRLNPSGDVERVLVALWGDPPVDRVAGVAADLLVDTDVEVTVLELAREGAESTLADRAEAALTERGVPADRLTVERAATTETVDAVVDAAAGFDVVVMAEARPSVGDYVFGDVANRVAEGFLGPVVVVRRVDEGE